MSSELAIAQAERAKGLAVLIDPALHGPGGQVTCGVQVSVLRSAYTCKMQVTGGLMTSITVPHPAQSRPSGLSGVGLAVLVVVAAWVALVAALGAAGAFVGRPGAPPVAIGVGLGAPLLVFCAWLRLSGSFRQF